MTDDIDVATLTSVAELALVGAAKHTQRNYARGLADFVTWFVAHDARELTRAIVVAHRQDLIDRGVGAASVNQRLAAVKKLTAELLANGIIAPEVAANIQSIKGTPTGRGNRTGSWLTAEAAAQLIAMPDATTVIGLRDRAILSILIGGGLRRAEVCALQVSHLQIRDVRPVLVDLVSKHYKRRSVPLAPWVMVAIETWLEAAGITEGYVFRGLRRGGRVTEQGITANVIWNITAKYSRGKTKPHDLRRTFARLARSGGAPLEQIQLSLGHSSLGTTERYLGTTLDLVHAPSDYIQLPRLGEHA